MLNIPFKYFHLSNSPANKTVLALTIFLLLSINLSCGKRKAPLPPIEEVSQRVEISGFQRGSQIRLNWIMPARNAADASILNVNRINIYRLAEPLDASLTLSESDFSSKSTLVATLPVKSEDFGLKNFNYFDTLEFAGQTARLRYAIRFVNSAGQIAAFSNFLIIEPTAKVAEAPKSVTAGVAETSVKLKWLAPGSNVDGSKPVNLLGYNIYRSASETEAAKLLNQTPSAKTEFDDNFFEFDKKYFYFIRSVSVDGSGNPVESTESNIVNVFAKDIFPPAAPTAVTIGAAPNNLSIFFAENSEKDIDGYKIFRSSEKDLPLSGWQNLTLELLKTNTFQDTKVEPGKTYYYYLVAVDKSGNQSRPSEVVSETAP